VAKSGDSKTAPPGLGAVAQSPDSAPEVSSPPRESPPGPGPIRALVVLGALVLGIWWLGNKVEDGRDDVISKVG